MVHFEIYADDMERAEEFYTEIFGWRINKMKMPEGGSTAGEPYFVVYTGDMGEDGMPKKPGFINGGIIKRKDKRSSIMNYITVKDIEATLSKIEERGGGVCMPKTEIGPNMGWIAIFRDSEGNFLGLHENAPKN